MRPTVAKTPVCRANARAGKSPCDSVSPAAIFTGIGHVRWYATNDERRIRHRMKSANGRLIRWEDYFQGNRPCVATHHDE